MILRRELLRANQTYKLATFVVYDTKICLTVLKQVLIPWNYRSHRYYLMILWASKVVCDSRKQESCRLNGPQKVNGWVPRFDLKLVKVKELESNRSLGNHTSVAVIFYVPCKTSYVR